MNRTSSTESDADRGFGALLRGGAGGGGGGGGGLEPALPVPPAGVPDIQPVPNWYFAFEGLLGASWDVSQSLHLGSTLVLVMVAVNLAVSSTVVGKRIKMMRAMWRNGRTRLIAIGLVVLRVGLHFVLGAAGMQVTGVAGHLAIAAAMGVLAAGLLWFDQRVMIRVLTNSGTRKAS